MRLGVVLVHYRTPELARRAVASFARDLAALAANGVSGRVVLVDNGSDAAGRETLARLGVELVSPGTNLGYAGGVNAGARRLGDADVLIVANPDVELLPGALAPLLDAIRRGAGAAGPRFYWDAGRRLRLPPTEARDAVSESLARLAPRSPGWARRARHRWRRGAHRHWRAGEEIPSLQLSGALLAVSRQAWERVGPFDEGFRLYFEETDWLTRLAGAGLAARYVPAAEVVHGFARSAAGEPRAAGWFDESARRYAAKHHPGWRRAALAAATRLAEGGRTSRRLEAAEGGAAVERLDLAPLAGAGPLWIEVSPQAVGFPAAGERVSDGTASWSLPPEVAQNLGGTWWARVTDERGGELLHRRLAVGSGG